VSAESRERFLEDTLASINAKPGDEIHGMPPEVLHMVQRHREAITAYLAPRIAEAPPKVRIPRLTLQNVPRYIAAVGRALNLGQVHAREANAMLYAAQMLVTAYRALGHADPSAPPEKRIGFMQAAAAELDTELLREL
jgi:hypothetical protein